MSSIVADTEYQVAYNYVIYALSALAVYEYIITFKREVESIWRRKWTAATALFLLNRYLLFAFLLVDWNNVANADSSSCFVALRIWKFIYFTQFAVIAAFATLRVYAISDRNLMHSSIVLLVSITPITTSAYYETTKTIVYDNTSVLKCFEDTSISSARVFSLALITRGSFIASDALVLVLTWWKARPNPEMMGVSISTLLLRDGTVHFTTMLTMNIAEIVILHYPQLQVLSFGAFVFNVMTPILISRFLLNLRQLRNPTNEPSGDHFVVSTAIGSFATPSMVIGNLGQPLDYGFENEPDRVQVGSGDVLLEAEI